MSLSDTPTFLTIVTDLDESRAVSHYILPVDPGSVAQVPIINNLHSSSQDLCSTHTHKQTAIVLVIRSLKIINQENNGALKKSISNRVLTQWCFNTLIYLQ